MRHFFGVRIKLGTLLGRFSIIYFRGLGLRIRVWVSVMEQLRLVWGYGQGKFRVRVIIRVRVVNMFGVMVTICKYFDPCYARATVVRARFLAAAFSDGSYLAHVNGAYLRHVTFCIARGPPLFIVSPISERGSQAAAHLTCRGTRPLF